MLYDMFICFTYGVGMEMIVMQFIAYKGPRKGGGD